MSEVVGLKELGIKLDKLFKEDAKKAVRTAMKPAIEVFRRQIRANAPIRVEVGVTGFRKSTKGKKNREPKYLKTHIGRWLKPNPDGSFSGFTGPTQSAFYGKLVEDGHRNVRTAEEAYAERWRRAVRRALVTKEMGGSDTPPHPFMRPAYDSRKNEAEQVFGTALYQEIVKGLS